MLKTEGFYIWVNNLDEAIIFYENLFEKKISHREKDRWADFGGIGLYNYTVDGDEIKKGNNITPELRAKDIKVEYERIKKLKPNYISEITILEKPVLYKYFQFEDKWGNIWEICEHYYDKF